MAAEQRLKRRIGLGLLTLYGVGVMVGAGIYVLVGAVAGAAGAWAPAAFLLAGVVAAFSAASFGELAGRLPESAGEAAYARAAFGSDALALAVGLTVALVGVVSAAAVLKGGVGYLRALAPAPEPALIVGLAALIALAAIWGVVESLAAAAALTLIEVLGLAAVIAVAALAGPPEPAAAFPSAAAAAPPAGGWLAGLAAGAFLAFFAFIGFEDMVNMAEETKRPAQAMPRAILLSLALVAGIYALVAWVSVRAVGPAALAESARPLALVVEQGLARLGAAAGGAGPALIAAVAVAAALNGVLAQVVMAARVLYGLGRRTSWLAPLHQVHPRFATPSRATLIAAAAVAALALAAPLSALAGAASMILIGVFALMNLALIRLKRRGPPPPGALDLPSWVPMVGFALSLAAAAGALLVEGGAH